MQQDENQEPKELSPEEQRRRDDERRKKARGLLTGQLGRVADLLLGGRQKSVDEQTDKSVRGY